MTIESPTPSKYFPFAHTILISADKKWIKILRFYFRFNFSLVENEFKRRQKFCGKKKRTLIKVRL